MRDLQGDEEVSGFALLLTFHTHVEDGACSDRLLQGGGDLIIALGERLRFPSGNQELATAESNRSNAGAFLRGRSQQLSSQIADALVQISVLLQMTIGFLGRRLSSDWGRTRFSFSLRWDVLQGVGRRMRNWLRFLRSRLFSRRNHYRCSGFLANLCLRLGLFRALLQSVLQNMT